MRSRSVRHGHLRSPARGKYSHRSNREVLRFKNSPPGGYRPLLGSDRPKEAMRIGPLHVEELARKAPTESNKRDRRASELPKYKMAKGAGRSPVDNTLSLGALPSAGPASVCPSIFVEHGTTVTTVTPTVTLNLTTDSGPLNVPTCKMDTKCTDHNIAPPPNSAAGATSHASSHPRVFLTSLPPNEFTPTFAIRATGSASTTNLPGTT